MISISGAPGATTPPSVSALMVFTTPRTGETSVVRRSTMHGEHRRQVGIAAEQREVCKPMQRLGLLPRVTFKQRAAPAAG